MQLTMKTLDAAEAGVIELDDAVFGLPARADILARVVRWQQAKRRQGTHLTKTTSNVSGTGKKPFRQKGTGRARQGSLKTVQHRGGAVAHGPVLRSHAHDLPKKVRKLGLKTALSVKARAGQLLVIDTTEGVSSKTGELRRRIEALAGPSVLFIEGPEPNVDFKRAAANLPLVDVLPQQGANVESILRREMLVLTRSAVEALEGRLK